MKIIRGINKIPQGINYPIIALGNFDGLHIGHQKILNKVIKKSRQKSGTSIIFTFEPHPFKILAPEKCPLLINTFHKKMELFKELGIDMVICADFIKKFAEQQ